MDRSLIVCTPDVCAGAPRLKDLRINVWNVISSVTRESLEEHFESFPDVSLEHIKQAVVYCKERKCLEDKPDHFCDGCSLRTEHDAITFEDYLKEFTNVQTTDDDPMPLGPGSMAYTESMEELRKEWEGEDGWKWAEDLYLHLKRKGVYDDE